MATAEATSTVRMATVADLPRMGEAAKVFYASSHFLREFELGRFVSLWGELLRTQPAVVFLHESDGEITGAIGGLVHPNIYGRELIAEEFFWFIEPQHRGGGVQLYRRFEAWAREQCAEWIQMAHLRDLMPSKVARFYEREGYTAIETRYEKRLT